MAVELSRLPAFNSSDCTKSYVEKRKFTCPVCSLCWIDQEEVQKEKEQDPDLPRVIVCQHGLGSQIPMGISTVSHYKIRKELSSVYGLLLYAKLLVPSASLRRMVWTKIQLCECFCGGPEWIAKPILVQILSRMSDNRQVSSERRITSTTSAFSNKRMETAWNRHCGTILQTSLTITVLQQTSSVSSLGLLSVVKWQQRLSATS